MAETFTLNGKEMKQCPGWEGNSFNCGRGSPRVIPAAGEVCENCSRGMRKRGQATREQTEENDRRRKAEIARLARGVALVQAKVDLADPLPLDPEAGAKVLLVSLIEALEAITDRQIEGRAGTDGSYWGRPHPIYADARWQILRMFAGLPAKDDDV